MTQRALALRAHITQPALADIERSSHDTRVGSLERLVNAAGYRLFLLPTTSSAVATWADFIFEELRSERRSEEVAFRSLIGLSDELGSAPAVLRVALCVAPPAKCGDIRFDAAIAAIVEHHLNQDRLPIPEWVHEPTRTLLEPWKVSPYTEISEVPADFLRHGVWLARSELASA
jgi:transcriptional regulator with XRE-family HTH domain